MASTTFAQAEERFGDRLSQSARVGLSLSSSESLRDAILSSAALFENSESDSVDRRTQQVQVLLAKSLELEEIQSQITSASKGAAAHLTPLLAWISGADYGKILAAGRDTGLFKASNKVSAAVRFCSDVSSWLSWSFGAAWSIIDTELDDPDPVVGILPLLVRYGVPSASSAFVSLLGVSDRNAARILGDEFDVSGEKASLQAVAAWMESIDVESLFPREHHHLRAELLRRQSFRGQTARVPYSFASFRSYQNIPQDAELTLVRSDTRVVVHRDGAAVGEILEEDRRRLYQFLANPSRPPLVIAVEAVLNNGVGVLAVVRG